MKNGLFKKSMSVFLSVLMLLTCWVWVAPTEAEALANIDTYRKADQYGTPFWNGADTYYSKWNSGGSYTTIKWPKHIYLDVSETLQSAGYYYDIEWYYGSNTDYRIINNGFIFGGYGIGSGWPDSYYTMTNMFNNYGLDGSLSNGGFQQTSNSTDGDLYIGVSGLDWDGAKTVIFRSRQTTNNEKVFMLGTPKATGTGRYSTSGNKPNSFGGWQQWKSNKWQSASDKYTKDNGSGNWTTDCYEGEWKEVAFDITIYDKSTLGETVTEAENIVNNLAAKYTPASLNNLKTVLNNNKGVLTTRATTQSNIDTANTNIRNAINNLVVAKYEVLFDNLIDFRDWNTSSASKGTISNVANGGFTLKANSDIGATGEATSSSPYFPVEPGKKYKVDIDITGDNWDVYIFFCNQNGDWIDFADGPTNRYSTTTNWGSTFTAPDYSSVVKAQIRVDANGANNSVDFREIRVYEEGKVADGVSYVPGKTYMGADPLGEKLDVPTRTGYKFMRWYADNNGNGIYDSGEEVTDDNGNVISSLQLFSITQNWILYSDWAINEYTVEFINYAGDVVSTQSVEHGKTPVTPANTAAYNDDNGHYAFSWPEISVATADATYKENRTSSKHSYTKSVTNPTCTTEGYTTYTCTICGKSYKDDYTPMSEHSLTETIHEDYIKSEATCKANATYYYSCEVCGAIDTEKNFFMVKDTKLPHDMKLTSAKQDATCTAAGKEAVYTCSYNCGTTQGGEVIPQLEHKDENKDHVCDYNCGNPVGECLDENKDHKCDYGCSNVNMGTHADSASDNDHVCDYGCKAVLEACSDKPNDGNHMCDVCGKDNITEHSDGEEKKENIKNETCTEAGSYDSVYYCTECNVELKRTNIPVPAKNHDWGTATYSWSEDGKTCTVTRICGNDAAHTESETVNTVGTVKDPATCTEMGSTKYTATFTVAWATEAPTKTVVDIPAKNHADADKDHVCDNGCGVAQGNHADADKNHACDYGCSEAMGTHTDSATDNDHVCDYGCKAVLEDCVDENTDHACDNGCDIYFGEHTDPDKNHACNYGCSVTIGTHADSSEDKDHVCDYGCKAVLEDCVDENTDHACDNGCEIYFGEHKDVGKDHNCDYGCSEKIGECSDLSTDKDHICDYGCGAVLEDCVDENTDHACDNGCEIYFGTHADSSEDKDHACDYGCGETLEACVDNDKDHACDNGCEIYFGTHTDPDKNHNCDYGCSEKIGECSDLSTDKDHICDYGCGAVLEACVDTDKDHACDNGCEIYFGEHKDEDKNHTCEYGCAEKIGDHIDADKNHTCDYGCEEAIGTCEDTDKDHACDHGCGATFGEHKDGDKNHTCDYGCSETIGKCEDADKDHRCDHGCGQSYGTHEDKDFDHACDYGCKEVIGTCEDADKDHMCDHGCGAEFGKHEDGNKDHTCDYGCEEAIGTHADSAEDTNHVCDYGCGAVLEDCVDNDRNHICDNGCGKDDFGTHADSAEDKDHICDYGCGAILEKCEDTDKNHACDNGCDKYFGEHKDGDKNHTCDYGCSVAIGTCEDADNDHDCDYGCDKYFGTHADSVEDTNHVCDYGCGAILEKCEDTDFDHACDYGCEIYFGIHGDSSNDSDHVCDYGCKEVLEDCSPAEAVQEDINDSTCYEEGSYNSVVYCSVCEEELSREEKTIAKKDHTAGEAVVENEVDSTCYAEGSYDLVVYCSVCEAEEIKTVMSRETKTIAKKAHTPAEAVREKEVAATCGQAGSYEEVVYCSVEACKYEMSRTPKTIDALEHEWIAATCTAPKTCKNCTATEGEALNHDWVAATCTTPKTCQREGCGITEGEVSGHTPVVGETIKATCTTEGVQGATVCSVCKEVLVPGQIIPVTDHTYGAAPIEIIPATCKKAEIYVYKCIYCGKLDNRGGEPIENGPHMHIVEIETIPATCEEDGLRSFICMDCDGTVKTEVLKKLGHADEDGDGECDNCGGAYVNQHVCNCICHKQSGIMKFLYKIVRFFWKLFGIGKSCGCGTVHY